MPDQTQDVSSLLDVLQTGRAPGPDFGTTPEPTSEAPTTPAPEAPAPDTPAETPEAPAETPEPKAPETPAEPVDPLEAFVLGEEKPKVEIPEDVKGMLKEQLGIEDIEAFKQARLVEQEEMGAFKAKAERLEAIEAALGKLPLELEEVISNYLQGKEADPIGRIKEMGVSVATPADKVDPGALVDHYFKGKFTPEQLEEIKGGYADDALKDVFSKYHELAVGKHSERSKLHQERTQQQQQSFKQAVEAREKSALEAVAFLKQDKAFAALVSPSLIEEFTKGQLEAKYLYNADGSYKPDALKRLVAPEILQKMVEKVREGAFSNGKLAGQLQERASMPTSPPPANGKRASQQPEATPAQAIEDALNQLQMGKVPSLTT